MTGYKDDMKVKIGIILVRSSLQWKEHTRTMKESGANLEEEKLTLDWVASHPLF